VTDHYDAVVIGSGAGGGTLARTLAMSGKRILLLERGNFLPRELCNWQPLQVLNAGRYVSQDAWYDAAGTPFEPRVHYYVGGATKLYGAALSRLRPADFGEIMHVDGVSPTWPLGYEEFEPWYAKAEWLYQVRGLHGEDPSEGSWSEEYPWPPISHEPLTQQIADDLDRAGYHPFHVPRGIMLNEANPTVSLCIRCGRCDGYPCLVHAKADADIIAVRPLLSRLNVTLLVNAEVRRLETDPRGRSVTKVIVRRGGTREEYSGDVVVLAAGAVNSAKVLLQSTSDRHPAGLANGSGQVGRNYMCHNVTDMVALGEKPNETVFQQTLGINAFYLANESRRVSYPAGNSRRWPLGSIQMLPRAGLPAAGHRTTGHRTTGPGATWCDGPDQRDGKDRAVGFRLMTEDLPRPGNRVTIDRDGRPHLAYAATNGAEALILRHELETMLGHAGLHVATDETLTPADLPGDAIADQAGTCRFGTDPETSVLDVNCKAHELDNLYVADAGFLPSAGAVGPALTVMANAIRVGEHLAHRLR
jgi:choline dehydrogenase-like flavoprotein